MEEEQIYQLFNRCWFRRLVLLPESSSSTPPPPPPLPMPSSQTEHFQAVPVLPPLLQCLNHRRSSSDSSFSPVSVLPHSKFDTILSGKESNSSSNVEALPSYSSKDESFPVSKKKKRRSKVSKSLSELEYEEVQGFMDLGFVFPKDDIDSELISILPGLLRWAGKVDGDDGRLRAEADVARPYLSESWGVVGEKGDDPLKMWRVPAAGDGVDMKDHLRCWAHAVASTFR